MKNLSKKNIDIVINKVLRETLEEKANEIKSKLKNGHKPKPKPKDDNEDEYPDFGFGDDIVSENNMCNECGSGYMEEGVCNECGGMGKKLYNESDEDIKQNNLQ